MELFEEDGYTSLIGFITFLAITIIALRLLAKQKGKVLFFFFLTWLFNAIFLLTDALGILLGGDVFLFRLEYSVFFAIQFVFWMAFLDYAQNDQIGWKKIGLGIAAAIAMFVWVWRPDSNEITIGPGSQPTSFIYNIPAEFGFNVLYTAIASMFAISMLYWTALTFKASPPHMKKTSGALLVAGVLLVVTDFLLVVSNFFLTDNADFASLILILFAMALIVSSLLTTIVIYKEPKIIHLLPYKVYRLFVSSKDGTPYYEKAWSEHEVNSIMTAGLLSAIGSFAKETLKDVQAGSISEIQMRKGILLTEMQYSPVNIALLASKASKDLRDALSKFSAEFVKTYYSSIYDKDGFPVNISPDKISQIFEQEKVDAIVTAHFSSIPSFIRPGITTDQLMGKIQSGNQAPVQDETNTPSKIDEDSP